MKNVILAAMAVIALSSSVQAETSGWDYFWGTTVARGLDPKINGWDDFWGQCQDPDKDAGACIGVVATGVATAILAPVAIVGLAVTGISMIPPTAMTAVTVIYTGPFVPIGMGSGL